jgi:hypothetical protein
VARSPHDDRFYHCDCLEQGENAQHDDRFYHCDCIEEAKLAAELEQAHREETQKIEVPRG